MVEIVGVGLVHRSLLLGLLIGWLLGIKTGLLGVVVMGGWYEYRVTTTSVTAFEEINCCGWELVQHVESFYYLRRPRIRLGQ